ncbi:MAG: type II toxin-antitoxin system HicA family toxin [Geobacteraceae bacterium]
MSAKHRKTLHAIFEDPIKSNISWADIEALFLSIGAERDEGSGSRIRFFLNGIRATFHRPHPQKETDRGAVKSVRNFYQKRGYDHDGIQGVYRPCGV